MNILVTGANGQLGRCIRDKVKSLGNSYNTYIFTSASEADDTLDDTEFLDITDEKRVNDFIKNKYINIIINCAAYTNVDKAESDYENTEKVNANAVKYLAEASLATGCKLIHISTDYVFNGQGFMPYTEERMTLPTSVYGETKRKGEEYIEASGCKYLIFRTAWLYSEYGKNFLKTMLRLFDEKDKLNVVNDQIGTPTYAGNLANLLVNIVEEDKPINGKETIPLLENGIYHFTDEGVCSWYDFAYNIYLDFLGMENRMGRTPRKVEITGITSKNYGSKAKRPYYSVLDKTKVKTDFKGLFIPKHWTVGVAEVIKKLINK